MLWKVCHVSKVKTLKISWIFHTQKNLVGFEALDGLKNSNRKFVVEPCDISNELS